jgi:hypothetical protein
MEMEVKSFMVGWSVPSFLLRFHLVTPLQIISFHCKISQNYGSDQISMKYAPKLRLKRNILSLHEAWLSNSNIHMWQLD